MLQNPTNITAKGETVNPCIFYISWPESKAKLISEIDIIFPHDMS